MEKMYAKEVPHGIRYVHIAMPNYKIGATSRPIRKRSKELWNNKHLIMIAKFATVVPFALEAALHEHLECYRMKRAGDLKKGQRKNLSGEMFRFSKEVVGQFKEIA